MAWLPRGLETLDWFYGRMTLANAAESNFFGAAAAKLTMKPSEYFARNFWIGASFLRPSEAPLCRDLGIGHVMWGADYPHTEGSYPYTTEALRVAFADYAEPDVRAMVESTAASFYGFDLDRAAADRRSHRPAGLRRGPAARTRASGPPRRPATRSTRPRSCGPGDGERDGRKHAHGPLRRPPRAGEPRDRGEEGRHLVRGGHRDLRDRARDRGRGPAATARAGARAPGPHHHHPGRDAGPARSSVPAGSALQARHGDRVGEYPILMPMTTEQSLIGGREVNGEPKKLAEVEVHRDGDAVSAHIARMGSVICEINGRISGVRDNYELAKTDFWFKLSPSCEAAGVLDQDPLARLRRKDREDTGARVDRRRAHPQGGAARPGGRPGGPAHGRPQLDGAGVDPGRARHRSGAPGGARAVHPPALRRPLGAGGEAMSDRYTIISADAHAGLPCEEYRPYLDAAYHAPFDEYLAERQANRDQALEMNYDYIMGWETDNEEGLRGAWDIEQRDKELDADGVTAEVMFADADAITGMASPPFGAGLSAGEIADPELAFAGARAHNRFLAEMCARSPERHGGIALVPITHGVERSVAEIEWLAEPAGHPRDHGADDVARPRALQPPGLRPGLGGLPGGRLPGAHALGRGAPGRVQRQHRHLPGRGGVVGGPSHVAPALLGRLRALPRGSSTS